MWLKLRANCDKEKYFYIQSSKIVLMDENKGYTHLQFDSPESWAKVKETSEEILQMINPQPSSACKGVK